ncbi:hypothetical protein CHS0354_035957 [Potamilus streckersoni]|uniref:Uncharacterized protein n=1 Tax=Potamilus streckersoni TaxID=2493646 RepID=A0AAE0TFZ7_9BIVA|nr:hypothetical protein CHS0354_035957 [Potamilus streckersoni]
MTVKFSVRSTTRMYGSEDPYRPAQCNCADVVFERNSALRYRAGDGVNKNDDHGHWSGKTDNCSNEGGLFGGSIPSNCTVIMNHLRTDKLSSTNTGPMNIRETHP